MDGTGEYQVQLLHVRFDWVIELDVLLTLQNLVKNLIVGHSVSPAGK